MPSRTFSCRISDELRARLDEAAKQTGQRKNSIITKALEEYLDRHYRAKIASEARRQSLLASREETLEERLWSEQADVDGWR